MKKLLAGVAALGAILYPLVIYFGLTRFEPRYLAIFLGLIVLLKIASTGGSVIPAALDSRHANVESTSRYLQVLAALLVLGLVFYALARNDAASLKFYPVVVSFFLLASFAWSVISPPTVIERIARITDPGLSPSGVRYTRKITLVWCGFFLCNGIVALYTALFASFATWALYNGFIAYVLIGCLCAGEYLYRNTYLKKS
jgi:uncharacterized membrane protein